MRDITTSIKCDVCKAEIDSQTIPLNRIASSVKMEELFRIKRAQLQVIFTSDQTEGRPCAPYLSLETIDLCTACKTRALNGEAVYAYGAQGYNTFYFKKDGK